MSEFMRDNWLSNRIFKSYVDLVDHCCEAWNKLVDQPWRIMSIGLRQWGTGSGQYDLELWHLALRIFCCRTRTLQLRWTQLRFVDQYVEVP